MSWHTSVNSELPIIEVCYADEVDRDQLYASTAEALVLLSSHARSRVLSDCTAITGGYTQFDLFQLAESVGQKGETHKLKNAIISTGIGDKAKNADFWKTTCHFRNMQVNIFQDRQSALEWLLR
jgi:hypothetical protein